MTIAVDYAPRHYMPQPPQATHYGEEGAYGSTGQAQIGAAPRRRQVVCSIHGSPGNLAVRRLFVLYFEPAFLTHFDVFALFHQNPPVVVPALVTRASNPPVSVSQQQSYVGVTGNTAAYNTMDKVQSRIQQQVCVFIKITSNIFGAI